VKKKKMNTKTKTIAVLMAAIIVSAVVVPMAMAQTAVDTQAQVTGSGTPPDIQYKFELPDDGDLLHTIPGTQVTPVPAGTKQVCVYIVATDPNGAADINRVWADVDYPSGGLKASGDATEITDQSTIEGITQDAVNQNIIDAGDKTFIDSHCSNSESRMFEYCFELTNCEEPGMYEVTANANDGSGGVGVLVNTFEYLSIKALKLDFTHINYGVVVPGVKQIVSGDDDMSTPNNPTVENEGNDPFKLRISATDMIGVNPANVIDATNLDSNVYGTSGPQEQNLNNAGITFDPIIEYCSEEPIDFSLLQDIICQDTYTGTLTIEAVTP
jgi:hypothetical protein